MLYSKSAAPTVNDFMMANKTLRAAWQMKDTTIRITHLPTNFVWVIMTGAAHANRPDLSSTSGHIILAAHPNILRGENVPVSVLGWNSHKIRRKVRSPLGAECAAMSTGLGHGDLLRVMYGEISGDLIDLVDYELYLTANCKSFADAVTAAGKAASKTSEDKRLAIELSMIKQRLAAHGTRFQWIDATYMYADVLTKGLNRGRLDLLDCFLRTSRYAIKPTKDMFEERAQARAARTIFFHFLVPPVESKTRTYVPRAGRDGVAHGGTAGPDGDGQHGTPTGRLAQEKTAPLTPQLIEENARGRVFGRKNKGSPM